MCYIIRMSDQQPNFFDTFTEREAERMKAILAELASESWALPVLNDVRQKGGLVGKNMANFFELRLGMPCTEPASPWNTKYPAKLLPL
jgi:hypothetical protein